MWEAVHRTSFLSRPRKENKNGLLSSPNPPFWWLRHSISVRCKVIMIGVVVDRAQYKQSCTCHLCSVLSVPATAGARSNHSCAKDTDIPLVLLSGIPKGSCSVGCFPGFACCAAFRNFHPHSPISHDFLAPSLSIGSIRPSKMYENDSASRRNKFPQHTCINTEEKKKREKP